MEFKTLHLLWSKKKYIQKFMDNDSNCILALKNVILIKEFTRTGGLTITKT